MTKKITDLEGRLDAALSRADKVKHGRKILAFQKGKTGPDAALARAVGEHMIEVNGPWSSMAPRYCPRCRKPCASVSGVFFERGEYDESRDRYDEEGNASTYGCKTCGVEFAIITGD